MAVVSSAALTVDDYLRALPAERREVVAAVRALVRGHLPRDIAETMNWGMICWEIPLSRYPTTYNGQPLMVAALAAQKNHHSLYLTCVSYDEATVRTLTMAFAAIGKKFDAGKSCLRFQRVDDLPVAALGEILASLDVDQFIARHEAGRAASGQTERKTPSAKTARVGPAATQAVRGDKGAAAHAAAKKVATAKVAANGIPAKEVVAKKTAGKPVPAAKATPTQSPTRKRASTKKART